MRLIHIIILILIINSFYVSAEEFTLSHEKGITYKNVTINLLSVGYALSSAVIKIGNETEKLEPSKEVLVKGLKLNLVELTKDFIKLNVTMVVECITNDDCKPKEPCTTQVCTPYNDCSYPKVDGCPLNDKCMAIGSITKIDKQQVYCSTLSRWEKRKTYNEQCIDNYQCTSNVCRDSKCASIINLDWIKDKMAPIWIIILFGLLFLIKGLLFITKTASTKNFLREFSYTKDIRIKVIGMFFIIAGILLIIWSLT